MTLGVPPLLSHSVVESTGLDPRVQRVNNHMQLSARSEQRLCGTNSINPLLTHIAAKICWMDR
jgi:hypothetical protein